MIEKVWHSPYLRTTETANIIAETFDIKAETEPLLAPFVKEEHILDKLVGTRQNIALVGHGPCLQRLLSLITQGKSSPIDIETSSAIIIEKSDNTLQALYVCPHTFTKVSLL